MIIAHNLMISNDAKSAEKRGAADLTLDLLERIDRGITTHTWVLCRNLDNDEINILRVVQRDIGRRKTKQPEIKSSINCTYTKGKQAAPPESTLSSPALSQHIAMLRRVPASSSDAFNLGRKNVAHTNSSHSLVAFVFCIICVRVLLASSCSNLSININIARCVRPWPAGRN